MTTRKHKSGKSPHSDSLNKTGAELKRMEELFHNSSKLAKIGGWEVDLIKKEVIFTAEAYRIYGLSPNDPMPTVEEGINYFEPEARPIIQQLIDDAIVLHKPYDVELPFINAQGKSMWIRTIGEAEVVDGKAIRLFGAVQDITDRKQIEDKLKGSEIRFRELVNTINSGVAVYKVINEGKSGADYIIQDFNKSALTIENLTLDEVVGKSLLELRPNIDEYGLIPIFQEVWKTGKHISFPAKQYVDDKYSTYYENQVYKLPNDEIVAVYDDVTDQQNVLAEIAESQQRFDLALEAAKDGIYDWNLVTNEIYYSPNWKKMLGYDEHELPNDFSIWEDLTKPTDVKISWNMQQKLIAKEIDRFELEFQMKHKEGHWIDVLSRAKAVYDKSGKAIRIVGTHVDITQQKQLEQTLHENQKRYEKAQAIGHVGNWEYYPETEKFWASDQAKRIYGFDLDSLDFTTPHVEDQIPERERVHQALVDLMEHDQVYDLVFDIIAKDSGLRKTIHSMAELDKDAQGNPIKVSGVIHDITVRKQAELKIQQDEEKYRLIVENANDGIEITQNDRVLFANKRFADMLGYSIKEVEKLHFSKIFTDQSMVDLKERKKNEGRWQGLAVQL